MDPMYNLLHHMKCLYKDCTHSSSINSCSFYSFPVDDCEYKIWKKYARPQINIRKFVNPVLCSCHFTSENRYPQPYFETALKKKKKAEKYCVGSGAVVGCTDDSDDCVMLKEEKTEIDLTIFEDDPLNDQSCKFEGNSNEGENYEILEMEVSALVEALDDCRNTEGSQKYLGIIEINPQSEEMERLRNENAQLKLKVQELENRLASLEQPMTFKKEKDC